MKSKRMNLHCTRFEAANGLHADLLRYESDTFSASGSGLTYRQADLIVAKLVRRIRRRLDGVMMSELLEDVKAEDRRK